MASEFDLIARHFARPTPSALLGPGDDCALLAPSPGLVLAATTDMLVAGVHFLPDTDPGDLGWKTAAVNLSDLAAMGARPRWLLLAGALPEANDAWLAAFAEGLFACSARFGAELVGGDTTRGPLCLSLTALGEVAPGQALRRDGARPDEDVWVSGQPGLAALGLAHLTGRLTLPGPAPGAGSPAAAASLAGRCIAALQRPQPRVALGQALVGLASAAIDVSDGLLADLGHLLTRSRLAAELHLGQLPCLPAGVDPQVAREAQLAGGDDYELAFTAPAAARAGLARLAATLELPLWRIGQTHAGPPGEIVLRDAEGQPVPIGRRGYDHFG